MSYLRADSLFLLSHHLYGQAPAAIPIEERITLGQRPLPGDVGTYEEVVLDVWPDQPELRVLVFRPTLVPVKATVVGLNFSGNHGLVADPDIPLTSAKLMNHYPGVVTGAATEAGRGYSSGAWCPLSLVAQGVALVTACYADLAPDDAHALSGLSPAWKDAGVGDAAAVGAWAWLQQRLADFVKNDASLTSTCLVGVGHSRLGKAALWAGAQDERFDLVIASQSGCGGAAPSKSAHTGAESVADITRSCPHWFHPRFAAAADNLNNLPVEQDSLIAAVAPRRVLLSNACDDHWANPVGQWEMLRAAANAWGETLPEAMPLRGQSAGGYASYWWRIGPHGMTAAEWQAWLPVILQLEKTL